MKTKKRKMAMIVMLNAVAIATLLSMMVIALFTRSALCSDCSACDHAMICLFYDTFTVVTMLLDVFFGSAALSKQEQCPSFSTMA